MMDAAQIAAKLTPAQVRALRDLNNSDITPFAELCDMRRELGINLIDNLGYVPSALGRAVLAALDAKEAGK